MVTRENESRFWVGDFLSLLLRVTGSKIQMGIDRWTTFERSLSIPYKSAFIPAGGYGLILLSTDGSGIYVLPWSIREPKRVRPRRIPFFLVSSSTHSGGGVCLAMRTSSWRRLERSSGADHVSIPWAPARFVVAPVLFWLRFCLDQF